MRHHEVLGKENYVGQEVKCIYGRVWNWCSCYVGGTLPLLTPSNLWGYVKDASSPLQHAESMKRTSGNLHGQLGA